MVFSFHGRYSRSAFIVPSIIHLLLAGLSLFHLCNPFPTVSSFLITHLLSSSGQHFPKIALFFHFSKTVKKLKLQIWLGSIFQSKEKLLDLELYFSNIVQAFSQDDYDIHSDGFCLYIPIKLDAIAMTKWGICLQNTSFIFNVMSTRKAK